MSTKTAELTGALLDYWVARAQGWKFGPQHKILECDVWRDADGCIVGTIPASAYKPSIDWEQGGPIIERERIELLHFGTYGYMGNPWEAQIGMDTHYIDQGPYDAMPGPTPLVAAMRAYVASKFGDEVQDVEGGAA